MFRHIGRFLCYIGEHGWDKTGNRTRKCRRCGKRQIYQWDAYFGGLWENEK